MATPTLAKQDIEVISLSSGATLYFKHMVGAPRIACAIYTYGGNRIDPMPGAADMVDDLLSEGTETRNAEDLAIALDSLSLEMDNDTRRDFSVMSGTLLEEDLEPSFELMADMLYHSTLSEFEKEKIRLHGELVMDMDSPRNRSNDLFMTKIFEKTPYRASHTNILDTLTKIKSVDALKQHYQDVYHPKNSLFSVVGDCDPQKIKHVIEQYCVRAGDKSWANENPPTPESLTITEPQYLTGSKDDSTQLHIFKGWFAPKASHPDYAAMTVLNTILGGAGLTSRLFLELRDKQGLAYMVRSQFESSKYTGLFYLYIGTEPNNRQKALTGFEVECQKLMDTPVSAQELAEAKENVLGRRVVFLETASQQCNYLGGQMALGLSIDHMASLPEQIMAVTSEQVQRMAQQVMSQPAVISAVGPTQFL